MFLEALPSAPNGKIDRRALPIPSSVRPALDTPFVPPRSPVEEILAKIWAEVLGFDDVGVDDNFFELGGHSLRGAQIIARVLATFHLELPLGALFETPTVAGLAAVITQSQEQVSVQAELAQLVTEVENLSDEEAQQLLSQMRPETIR
jgi:acyl carrier protein